MNYYSAIQFINEQLLAAGFHTITFGDIDEVDIQRQNIYPLAHIVPENASIATQPFEYTFTIIAIDKVFFPKGDPREEMSPEFGLDNTQDVFADIHWRLAQFCEYIKRKDTVFQLVTPVDIEPLKERWEQLVSGWVCPITLQARNYASIC